MKWSVPFFDYHGTLCSMAAFKEYVAFRFWKGALVVERSAGDQDGAAGQFGRITSVKDLPSKAELTRYVKKAMKLNEEGIAVPRAKVSRAALPVPAELTAALARNKKARDAFDAFPPSHRREYCEWIGEAKRDETRATRVKQAVEWIAEGKARNWKYER
jgi:uncharacterized protein YdeI (YjbR/CyaY-like superfamily)